MQRSRLTIRFESTRSGLAPLEFVFALPLLLLITALMVNFGDAGRWKIRAQGNAKYAATRSLSFRTGQVDSNPRNWPAPRATLSNGADADLDPLDPFWNSGPDITTPAIRGPQISDPWVGTSIRVKRELEMPEGAHNGNASTVRRYQQAPRAMPGGNGRYSFDLDQAIFNHNWDFSDLGYSSTNDRRARLWYAISWDELGLSGLHANLNVAFGQLQSNPTEQFLYPLDLDDEWLLYTGRARDFIPEPDGCALEADQYRMSASYIGPNGYLERIRDLPERMAREFRRMYQTEIARQRGNPPQIPPQPPPPGGEHWTALEVKVQQLQSFLANLPAQYQ